MSQLIPSIGMSGVWSLKPPLETYLSNGRIYTCKAIRSISDFTSQNDHPKNTIYKKLGLDEAAYQQDFNNNVYIVSLQDDLGNWEYIPASYILAYPDTNGITYRKFMVGLGFPKIPSDTDFSTLISKLQSEVFDTLGLNATVKVVPASETYLVDELTHENNLTIWENNKTFAYTDRTQIRVLEEENSQLKGLIQKLQACFTAACNNGNGSICLPKFNPDTPGHTGYIDAADICPPWPIYPDNAIDLFLYGEMKCVRREGWSPADIVRSDPWESDPDDDNEIDPIEIIYPPDPEGPFPMTPIEIIITYPHPSEMEVVIARGIVDISDENIYLGRGYIQILFDKCIANRGMNAVESFIRNADNDMWYTIM